MTIYSYREHPSCINRKEEKHTSSFDFFYTFQPLNKQVVHIQEPMGLRLRKLPQTRDKLFPSVPKAVLHTYLSTRYIPLLSGGPEAPPVWWLIPPHSSQQLLRLLAPCTTTRASSKTNILHLCKGEWQSPGLCWCLSSPKSNLNSREGVKGERVPLDWLWERNDCEYSPVL